MIVVKGYIFKDGKPIRIDPPMEYNRFIKSAEMCLRNGTYSGYLIVTEKVSE